MGKKILFIGGIWDTENEDEILKNSIGAVQNAANVFQKHLIQGLAQHNQNEITIVNSLFIGSFPLRYKKARIKSFHFSHTTEKEHIDYNCGFWNFPVIKHYSRYQGIKRTLKKINKFYDNSEIYVCGYSMTYSTVKSLLYAKRSNSKVKTCLVIPDLPEYMNLGNKRSVFFNILKYISNNMLYRYIKDIDSFVVLTRYMYPKLGIENKPYVVVEGIAPDNLNCISVEKNVVKRILYTGSLSAKYGICDLIDAFLRIQDDTIKLTICGYGDAEKYIKEKANIDERIEFLGSVSNSIARELQRKSYLLVNPRNNNEEYTKYSFPSKTLEYMMSGRPILMYELKGIPEEYNSYLFLIKNSLYESLKSVLELTEKELSEKGQKARMFALNYKNKYAQTKKIIEMLEDL